MLYGFLTQEEAVYGQRHVKQTNNNNNNNKKKKQGKGSQEEMNGNEQYDDSQGPGITGDRTATQKLPFESLG